MPAFALGVIQAAILTRTTRAAVLEVLRADHVRTARAKGLAEAAVTWKHVVRNALLTIVTIVGLQLGMVMSTMDGEPTPMPAFDTRIWSLP